MTRLLLLRHAKSSWAEPGTADRDRPLNPRGRRAAQYMAQWISQAEFPPERILCSPSRRTRETLAALLPHLEQPGDVAILDELYDPLSDDYCETIAAHGGNANCLLLIGHNPTIHTTALRLIGNAEGGDAAQLAAKFPTAALAVIDFDGSWQQIAARSGSLVAFVRPRELEESDTASDDE